MPVAGAVTALRLIFLGVVMRRSLATGGSTTELSATDAWAHADGGVAEGRADRQVLQGQVSKQRAEHLLSSRVIGTAADPAKVSQACILPRFGGAFLCPARLKCA